MPASVTVTVTEKFPVWFEPGVQPKVAVPLWLSTKLAPVGTFVAAKLNASSEGRRVVIVIDNGWAAVAVRLPIGASTGGRLTLPTVIVKVSEALSGGMPASVTVTVTEKFPVWFEPGVQSKAAVPLWLSTKLAPVGTFVAAKLNA